MKTNNHYKLIAISFIILISIIKCYTLINKGLFYFPDENRYKRSFSALYYFQKLDFKSGTQKIFEVQGRPASAIFLMLPAFTQEVSKRIFGFENTFDSLNSYPLFLFNLVVQFLICWLIFRISIKFFNDQLVPWLAIMIFSMLDASFIYLQHALPCDLALAFLLFALIIVANTSDHNEYQHSFSLFKAGIITSLGFLCYPGYIHLVAVIIGLLAYKILIRQIRFTKSLFFFPGFMIVLGLFELTSLAVGTSYFKSAAELSGTIIQGSFEESFSFIFKYLIEVEGLMGFCLLAGGIGFLVLGIWQTLVLREKNEFQVIMILSLITYLGYGLSGFWLEKNVYYGRLIHQYIPFLSITTAWLFSKLIDRGISNHRLKLSVKFAVGIFLFFTNLDSVQKFSQFLYPRDIFNNKKIQFEDAEIFVFNEFPDCQIKIIKKRESLIKKSNNLTGQIYFLNFCYFYPLENFGQKNIFLPPSNSIELINKCHIINYPGYQFEGYSIKARENIKELDIRLKVYSINKKGSG